MVLADLVHAGNLRMANTDTAGKRGLKSSLLREPLVHFLIGGLALFALYGLVGQPDEAQSRKIVIDKDTIATLAAQYEATWQRPPTQEQLSALVNDHVREEVLYREGLSLGLDRDDAVVKRRLSQKVEVLSEEYGGSKVPDDRDLQAYLEKHADTYRQPGTYTFEQVLLVPERHPDVEAALATARRQLAAGERPDGLGDAGLLPARVYDASQTVVIRDFGKNFAAALDKAGRQGWIGPVRSNLGLHLVRLTEHKAGGLPPLAQVKGLVAEDMEEHRRKAAAESYFKQARQNYSIEIDKSALKVPG